MSRSDWVPNLTTGGLIVAGAAFLLLGFGLPATYCVVSNADSSTYRQHQPEQRPAGHAEASEQGQNQESRGVIALGLGRIAREIEKANRREDAPDKAAHEKSDVDAQWAMSQWGCMMALTGFWQFVASVIGLVVLAYTLRLNRDATKAAVDAASASQAAVAVAQANAKLELRAYLSLSPAAIGFDWHNNQLFIYVEQRNNGQTPALKCRFFGCVEFIEHPLPDDFSFPLIEPDPGTNVIHPGHVFTVTPSYKISAEEMSWINTGGRGHRFYFLGAISYEDVFGRGHTTKVCWSYNSIGLRRKIAAISAMQQKPKPEGRGPHEMNFEYTDRFNDAT